MIGYFLVSYGPKPTGRLDRCRAARQQVRNLLFAAERLTGKRELIPTYDYAREVHSLASLPELRAILAKAAEANTTIFIDTFLRLFSKCPMEGRVKLLEELQEYSGHFKDIHSGQDIGNLLAPNKYRMLVATSPVKFVLDRPRQFSRRPEQKRDQTRKATQASQTARAEAATRKAEELQRLKEELLQHQDAITNAKLAREANKRGLQTTRRGVWSAASVTRALKRLE